MIASSTWRLLIVAAVVPTLLAIALQHQINWPRTIFRFVFGVVGPTKERFFPSDDLAISPQSRGMAWILQNAGPPPPHDVQTIRTMMTYFWPHVWPKNDDDSGRSIRVETITPVPTRTDDSETKLESLLILPSRPDDTNNAALIHLHGGGLIAGTTGTERGFAIELARRLNIPVLSVDYRLVPEHTVEEAVDDVVVAYKWLLEKYPERHISFLGGSAGAALSLLSALKLTKEEGIQKQPKSLVLLSPGPGMEFLPGDATIDEDDNNINEEQWKSLTENAPKDALMVGNFYQWVTSIVFGSSSDNNNNNNKNNNQKKNKAYFKSALRDLSGLPPCLVTAGSYELILGGIQNLQAALKEAGVSVDYREYPKMQHVHLVFFEITPEASQALDEVITWLTTKHDQQT